MAISQPSTKEAFVEWSAYKTPYIFGMSGSSRRWPKQYIDSRTLVLNTSDKGITLGQVFDALQPHFGPAEGHKLEELCLYISIPHLKSALTAEQLAQGAQGALTDEQLAGEMEGSNGLQGKMVRLDGWYNIAQTEWWKEVPAQARPTPRRATRTAVEK
jgi:hypothetical protein